MRRAVKSAEEGRHHGKRERREREPCATVFSRANWDELPTGNLTLVMRH